MTSAAPKARTTPGRRTRFNGARRARPRRPCDRRAPASRLVGATYLFGHRALHAGELDLAARWAFCAPSRRWRRRFWVAASGAPRPRARRPNAAMLAAQKPKRAFSSGDTRVAGGRAVAAGLRFLGLASHVDAAGLQELHLGRRPVLGLPRQASMPAAAGASPIIFASVVLPRSKTSPSWPRGALISTVLGSSCARGEVCSAITSPSRATSPASACISISMLLVAVATRRLSLSLRNCRAAHNNLQGCPHRDPKS